MQRIVEGGASVARILAMGWLVCIFLSFGYAIYCFFYCYQWYPVNKDAFDLPEVILVGFLVLDKIVCIIYVFYYKLKTNYIFIKEKFDCSVQG